MNNEDQPTPAENVDISNDETLMPVDEDNVDIELDVEDDFIDMDDEPEEVEEPTEPVENPYHAVYSETGNPITDHDSTDDGIPLARYSVEEIAPKLAEAEAALKADPRNKHLREEYEKYLSFMRRLEVSEPTLREMFETEAHWDPVISVEGREIGPRFMQFRKNGNNQALRGDNAMAYANAYLRRDRPIQIPCWHSGFYISIGCPGADEIIDMETEINMARVSYGRTTHGLIFSANSIYLEHAVMQLVMQKMISTTYPIKEDVWKVLDQRDHIIIAAYLLKAMYPSGVAFTDYCPGLDGSCIYKRNILLDPGKAVRIMREGFTDFMRKHMMRRNDKMNMKDIERYRDELNSRNNNVISLDQDRIRLTLAAPSTENSFIITEEWIDSIVKRTNDKFSNRMNNQEFNAYIERQAAAAELAGYAHWVKRIELVDPKTGVVDSVIDDVETIVAMLTSWSNAEDLRPKIMNVISSFIARSLIAIFGVPRAKCPKCGKEHPMSDIYPGIVPLEIFELFFILARLYTVRGQTGE